MSINNGQWDYKSVLVLNETSHAPNPYDSPFFHTLQCLFLHMLIKLMVLFRANPARMACSAAQ